MYVVVARPVEYDATQRPAGAIVGIKEVNKRFVERPREAHAHERRVLRLRRARRRRASASTASTRRSSTSSAPTLKNVDDKAYGDSGRTDLRMLSDELGAMYARLPGDAWALGGGFAVPARAKSRSAARSGFLTHRRRQGQGERALAAARRRRRASRPSSASSSRCSSTPTRCSELVMQAERLKAGGIDGLQVARFRGAYRLVAQNLNQGMERSIEKAGGVTRKPADLESILGPAPRSRR